MQTYPGTIQSDLFDEPLTPVEGDTTGLIYALKTPDDKHARIVNIEIERCLRDNPNLAFIRDYQRTLYHIQKRRIAVGNARDAMIRDTRRQLFEVEERLPVYLNKPLPDRLKVLFSTLLSIDMDTEFQILKLMDKWWVLRHSEIEKDVFLIEHQKREKHDYTTVYRIPYEIFWRHENVDLLMENVERNLTSRIGKLLESVQIWIEYLSKVRGIGPRLAGTLIATIVTPKRFNGNPGRLMSYAGLALDADGQIIKRKSGEVDKMNSELKQALLGDKKIVDQFTLQKSHYGTLFLEFKEALTRKNERLPESERLSKMHIHRRTKRKIAKLFLSHLMEVWCGLEGIDFREAYVISELGHDKIKPFTD